MEWVETTGKTVEDAKDLALDQLGVTADEAEFEVVEEPRPGLFGRLRGEARVRARVRPAAVRPKQHTRRPRPEGRGEGRGETAAGEAGAARGDARRERNDSGRGERSGEPRGGSRRGNDAIPARRDDRRRDGAAMGDGSIAESPPVEDVSAAAESFVVGLAGAFGYDVTTRARIDGTEIDVAIEGEGLGLLIGPGGRTLLAVQDLARVAAQRRLGDHETRLRVDVAGYREKRRVALERFATSVAEQVRETSMPRALDPMPSADRKVIHDTLTELAGVTSRSEGEDPYRRIIISPA